MSDREYIPQGKLTPELVRKIFQERQEKGKKVRLVIDIQEPKMVFQDVSDELNLVFTNRQGDVFVIPMFAISVMYPEKVYPLEDRTFPMDDQRRAPRVHIPKRTRASGGNIIEEILKRQG